MGVRSFCQKSLDRFRERGTSAFPEIVAGALTEGASKTLPLHRYGRGVFEHEWEVLVILDGCRADAYREVIDPNVDTAWSCASSSHEWLIKTFADDAGTDLGNTAYVSGNPFTDHEDLRGQLASLGLLDEVWRYAWDDERGTMPPGPITDRAISVARDGTYDRIIVHYMQPHFPFIGANVSWGYIDSSDISKPGNNPWDKCRVGELDPETVWDAYTQNLEFVWESIETLLENIEGRVVVTADHGNALGEWGVWGHRDHLVAPTIRRVPWDVRKCTDQGTYNSPTYDRNLQTDPNVNDRLKHLGYK